MRSRQRRTSSIGMRRIAPKRCQYSICNLGATASCRDQNCLETSISAIAIRELYLMRATVDHTQDQIGADAAPAATLRRTHLTHAPLRLPSTDRVTALSLSNPSSSSHRFSVDTAQIFKRANSPTSCTKVLINFVVASPPLHHVPCPRFPKM